MAKKGHKPWNKGLKTNKPAHNRLNIDEDELYDLYINQGLSSNDIAKIYKCATATVLNWLRRTGTPIRDDGTAVKLNRSKWSEDQELARSQKYHQTWLKKTPEEIRSINQKKQNSPNINSPEAIKKANQTRLYHGTTRQSRAEEDFYHKLLVLGLDTNDIIHQYTSDKYPFNCDFYVKSKDLYIEYQGHYTHGYEPFDSENEEHLRYLEDMQRKGKDMSTWFKRDVIKLNTARRNNIKLLLVYPHHKNYLVQKGQLTTININDIDKI